MVSLTDIAQTLKDAKHKTKAKDASESDVKVQLIYAFNGTGKTRLSREFKSLLATKAEGDTELEEPEEVVGKKILYYNAFTEDLFYWDNDLEFDAEPKLKIHPNAFTKWIFEDQGQEPNIISHFQHYTDENLTPHFNGEYVIKDKSEKDLKINAFTEVTFSYERGNDEHSNNVKISKGEESNFVWCVFYSLLEQVIEVLNLAEPSDRDPKFDQLEYVFIDDPVSSLDDNRLIELAVDLAQLIKSSESDLKFIITTHNPLFYNVLHNEFKRGTSKKYFLKKNEDGEYELIPQSNDSPFSYHLFLKTEIEKARETNQLKKYHFNFLRNILEKTSTFLGYDNWVELLSKNTNENINPYVTRIINISSHSKHSGDEMVELTEDDKRVLIYLIKMIKEPYKFK
jgi:wobble nucleotide-excising tRNase